MSTITRQPLDLATVEAGAKLRNRTTGQEFVVEEVHEQTIMDGPMVIASPIGAPIAILADSRMFPPSEFEVFE